MAEGEQPAMMRYDTLAFKDETGQNTIWLNGEAHAFFWKARVTPKIVFSRRISFSHL